MCSDIRCVLICPKDFLITTKKLHLKSIIHELLWFLKGDTNIKYLKENGVRIWDEWADENGDLGHVYGYQWRSWPSPDGKHIDQISQVVEALKHNPDSRRIIVSMECRRDRPDGTSSMSCFFNFTWQMEDFRANCTREAQISF